MVESLLQLCCCDSVDWRSIVDHWVAIGWVGQRCRLDLFGEGGGRSGWGVELAGPRSRTWGAEGNMFVGHGGGGAALGGVDAQVWRWSRCSGRKRCCDDCRGHCECLTWAFTSAVSPEASGNGRRVQTQYEGALICSRRRPMRVRLINGGVCCRTGLGMYQSRVLALGDKPDSLLHDLCLRYRNLEAEQQ